MTSGNTKRMAFRRAEGSNMSKTATLVRFVTLSLGWLLLHFLASSAAAVALPCGATVDECLSACPTAAEVAAVDARIDLVFEADPSAGEGLVCTAAEGSADLTKVQKKAYQALLMFDRLRFDAPLPFTQNTLDVWLYQETGVQGIRFRDDIAFSSCCDPPNYLNLIVGPLNETFTERWINPQAGAGLKGTVLLVVHEARHNQGLPHTCGTNDNTLDELGSWSAQYHLGNWLAYHSDACFFTPADPTPTYYLQTAATDSWFILNTRFCEDGPDGDISDLPPVPRCGMAGEIGLVDVAGLIVPGFEVDTLDPEGPTTFFGVRNTSENEITVNVDYYGDVLVEPPLRRDVFMLEARQTLSRNVRSNLSGLAVPDNRFAAGLIVVREAGQAGGVGPRNIEGDYFRVDFGNDFASGERLVTAADLCLRQEVRFVEFGSGVELRILVNRPRGDDGPSFSYTAYNESGAEVSSGDYFTANHLNVLGVNDLVEGPSFGTIVFDFSASAGGWVSARYSAFGRFSLELNSVCR